MWATPRNTANKQKKNQRTDFLLRPTLHKIQLERVENSSVNHVDIQNDLVTTERGKLSLKCDGTRAETTSRLSPKRTSPFKSAGGQFSRLLAAEVCASAVLVLDTPCSQIVWRVTGYPLHSPVSPSLPLPCVTVCHQVLNELYNLWTVLAPSQQWLCHYRLYDRRIGIHFLPHDKDFSLCHHVETGSGARIIFHPTYRKGVLRIQ